MKTITIILRCLLGGVFILSGVLKLYPIEPFEYNLAYLPGIGLQFAAYLARFIIGLELLLGLLLLLGIKMKKITLPLGLLMMAGFSVYLVYGLIVQGNQDNCGCFGTYLEMSSVESLLKNGAMIVVILLLYFYPQKPVFKYTWVWVPVFIISMTIPVILNPPWYYVQEGSLLRDKDAQLDFTKLPKIPLENGDSLDVSKTETPILIGFLSLTCEHCKNGALRLSAAKENGDIDNMYVFFLGKEEKVLNFFEESRSNFPYALYNEKDYFNYAGPMLPAYLLVKNGKVIERWNNATLTASEIKEISTYN